MYYCKTVHNGTEIEFTNSFSGKETIIVNGQIVSEKSSIMGTNHHFEVVENGEVARYTLRTKIGGPTMVLIDIIRNRVHILDNYPVPHGSGAKRESKEMKKGLKALRMFDLAEAVTIFNHGLDLDPKNPKLHFYLACAYSLQEKKKEAFTHLQLAIDNKLANRDRILKEDALAFIRVEEEFEGFCLLNKIELNYN